MSPPPTTKNPTCTFFIKYDETTNESVKLGILQLLNSDTRHELTAQKNLLLRSATFGFSIENTISSCIFMINRKSRSLRVNYNERNTKYQLRRREEKKSPL